VPTRSKKLIQAHLDLGLVPENTQNRPWDPIESDEGNPKKGDHRAHSVTAFPIPKPLDQLPDVLFYQLLPFAACGRLMKLGVCHDDLLLMEVGYGWSPQSVGAG